MRARWERIDWTAPLPPDSPGMPEGHYMGLDPLGLDPARRVALGRLFTCFTCELFVHFEGYVIRYLERVDPSAAARARAHYSCFNEIADPTEYGHGVALGLTQSCREDVVQTLLELRRAIRACDLGALRARAPALLRARDRTAFEQWLADATRGAATAS